jgi:queuine/archaeosine tRNA-ribosyltransferase
MAAIRKAIEFGNFENFRQTFLGTYTRQPSALTDV